MTRAQMNVLHSESHLSGPHPPHLISRRRSLTRLALAALMPLCALAASRTAHAQATYAASGPGGYVSLGVAASGFQQSYGQHYVGGETIFVDANLFRRVGIEAEGRRLNFHTTEDIKENTYLIGPKYSGLAHNLRPYAKFLVGRGTLDLPFHYGVATGFVMAPGAGLDWHLPNTRIAIRVADFEYQIWPQYFFGNIHPYGITSGVSFDLFRPSSTIRGHHF